MNADQLASELQAILPAPAAARKIFIAAAIDELKGFRDSSELVRNLRDADGQMERLEAASRKFAQALAAVSTDAWDLIEQDVITDVSRDRPRAWTEAARQREGEQATRAVGLAAMVVGTMRGAGSVAEKIAEAAALRRTRWAKRMADEEKKLTADAAFRSFVRQLIERHVSAYGCKPSYSHEGYFCRALVRLIEVGRIPRRVEGPVAPPSEEWLREVINETAGPDTPPPKRGRKLH